MEKKLRLTKYSVEHAPGSQIFWLDSEGNITFANETTCQQLGYTREESRA